MTDLVPVNGFVLAGGKSTRMGQDKAMMRYAGRPLVVRAAELLESVVRNVALLGSPDRYGGLGYPVIPDSWPEVGPLAGLCAGLIHSDTQWNLFLACDLPLVTPRCLALLIERSRNTNFIAVVPQTEHGWQPLCAVYHVLCRPIFEAGVRRGNLSVVGLFDEVCPDAIAAEEMVTFGLTEDNFLNVNTPDDWTRLAPREN